MGAWLTPYPPWPVLLLETRWVAFAVVAAIRSIQLQERAIPPSPLRSAPCITSRSQESTQMNAPAIARASPRMCAWTLRTTGFCLRLCIDLGAGAWGWLLERSVHERAKSQHTCARLFTRLGLCIMSTFRLALGETVQRLPHYDVPAGSVRSGRGAPRSPGACPSMPRGVCGEVTVHLSKSHQWRSCL